MELRDQYASRYFESQADAREIEAAPRQDTLQEFLAYLYAAIRHDDAVVQAVDRVLKERYGEPQPEQQ